MQKVQSSPIRTGKRINQEFEKQPSPEKNRGLQMPTKDFENLLAKFNFQPPQIKQLTEIFYDPNEWTHVERRHFVKQPNKDENGIGKGNLRNTEFRPEDRIKPAGQKESQAEIPRA